MTNKEYSNFVHSFNTLIKELNSAQDQQGFRLTFKPLLNENIMTVTINRTYLENMGLLANMYFPLMYDGKFIAIQRYSR